MPLVMHVRNSKMAAEEVQNIQGSLALDEGKQKEFEEKVKRIKDKVSGGILGRQGWAFKRNKWSVSRLKTELCIVYWKFLYTTVLT